VASSYDAVVIGSGPNGLAAAIVLAQANRSVMVFEGAETVGGGTRSAALTLPGFIHDICSAVHPLAVASPFLSTLPLAEHGLNWIEPPAALAHPLDDGRAVIVERSIEGTAERLGDDADAYRRSVSPSIHFNSSSSPDSVCSPFAPLAASREAASKASPPALFSQGWPGIPCCRSSGGRAPPSDLFSESPLMRWAGPYRGAARKRSPIVSHRICGRSAARW